MNKARINALCARDTINIVEAMEKIDANSCGILFLVDDNNKLVGVITDGDIRRFLIKTGDLNTKVSVFMNQKPMCLFAEEKGTARSRMLEKNITALPIVDRQKNVLDIILENEDVITGIESDALSDVPVIIMAGGKGTRLYPYTKILPKPLIPIGDIPILERIINRFCEYGALEYYMTVNYKKGMIKSHFAELQPNYHIEYVEEDQPLGTAGSIKLINKTFDVPVIITNCDSLIGADYEDIYNHHKKSGNVMTIVSALKNIEVPYGVLRFAENGIVTAVEEKPKLSYLINTGMYIVNPEILEKIPENTFFHMTHLMDTLMKEGLQVGMYPISEDLFLDMGEFEEMRRMEEKLNIK